jgi:degradative hydroxymethylglutaryl-CoA reductase
LIFCFAYNFFNNINNRIIALANAHDQVLIANGGGATDFETKVLDTVRGPMLIVYLYVNVCDAMGSNIVNTMMEGIAPFLEDLTGGYARLRIVSNYAVRRVVKARAIWKKDVIGSEVVEGILDADAFAQADPYRAATHNKGIMNGVDAVVLATGKSARPTINWEEAPVRVSVPVPLRLKVEVPPSLVPNITPRLATEVAVKVPPLKL